jgi:biopolymer transport protein ExbD
MRVSAATLFGISTILAGVAIYLAGRHWPADLYARDTDSWGTLVGLVGVGIVLSARAFTIDSPHEIGPMTESLPMRRKWPLLGRMSMLPSFGLMGALFLFVGLSGMMVFSDPSSRGLRVSISAGDYAKAMADREVAPLIVRVEQHNKKVSYLVEGKRVDSSDLDAALKHALSQRANWTVFVEGDRGLPYNDIVFVIDRAHELRAKVVMLTPRMRALSQVE